MKETIAHLQGLSATGLSPIFSSVHISHQRKEMAYLARLSSQQLSLVYECRAMEPSEPNNKIVSTYAVDLTLNCSNCNKINNNNNGYF